MFRTSQAWIDKGKGENLSRKFSRLSLMYILSFYPNVRLGRLEDLYCFKIKDGFNCLSLKREVYSVYFPFNKGGCKGKRIRSLEELPCSR